MFVIKLQQHNNLYLELNFALNEYFLNAIVICCIMKNLVDGFLKTNLSLFSYQKVFLVIMSEVNVMIT